MTGRWDRHREAAELGRRLGAASMSIAPGELAELLDALEAHAAVLDAIRIAGPFAVPPAVYRAAVDADAARMMPAALREQGR